MADKIYELFALPRPIFYLSLDRFELSICVRPILLDFPSCKSMSDGICSSLLKYTFHRFQWIAIYLQKIHCTISFSHNFHRILTCWVSKLPFLWRFLSALRPSPRNANVIPHKSKWNILSNSWFNGYLYYIRHLIVHFDGIKCGRRFVWFIRIMIIHFIPATRIYFDFNIDDLDVRTLRSNIGFFSLMKDCYGI